MKPTGRANSRRRSPREKSIRADTLRHPPAKVDEYSENHRAHGLPDDLLAILKDDLAEHGENTIN